LALCAKTLYLKNLDGSLKNKLFVSSFAWTNCLYSNEYRTSGLFKSYLHCLVFKEHRVINKLKRLNMLGVTLLSLPLNF